MLEVQNRALIKTAQERAQRISNLERELQQAGREVERLKVEAERLKVEREFYHKRVLALEQDNHELTEAATKCSLWGQKLERELAKIDPMVRLRDGWERGATHNPRHHAVHQGATYGRHPAQTQDSRRCSCLGGLRK